MILKSIFFFGPAGSGKGTQKEFLESELTKKGAKWETIEVGSLLREFAKDESGVLNKEISKIMKNGEMVPSIFSLLVTTEKLLTIPSDVEYIIFDGACRRLFEAKPLFEAFSILKNIEKIAIVLDVSDEEVIKRLELRDRADDKKESIKTRLAIFRDKDNGTQQVIDYIKENNIAKICMVNGVGTIEEVNKRLLKCI